MTYTPNAGTAAHTVQAVYDEPSSLIHTTSSGTDTVNPRPTVTINQAVGQADPTNTAPINFTAVFSEIVTGFGPSDVSFAGSTTPGTLAATITTVDEITYNVAVSGMTGDGVVTSVSRRVEPSIVRRRRQRRLDQHRQLGHLRHHRAARALDARP